MHMARIASGFSNFYSISRLQRVNKNEKYVNIYKGQFKICELLIAEKLALFIDHLWYRAKSTRLETK